MHTGVNGSPQSTSRIPSTIGEENRKTTTKQIEINNEEQKKKRRKTIEMSVKCLNAAGQKGSLEIVHSVFGGCCGVQRSTPTGNRILCIARYYQSRSIRQVAAAAGTNTRITSRSELPRKLR